MQSTNSNYFHNYQTQILLALKSALSDYASGIPTALIEAAVSIPKTETLSLSSKKFITALVTPDERANAELMDLLKKILEKGLDVSWANVEVVTSNDVSTSSSAPRALIFGVFDHSAWTQGLQAQDILCTTTLTAIQSDPTVKRQFWSRLQVFKD